jgi:hypothetical protein
MATVTAVSPDRAFNDAATEVDIEGGPFRPAFSFDTAAGAANAESGAFSAVLTTAASDATMTRLSIPLGGVKWLAPTQLEAIVPASVAAGTYDVSVTDPRGRESTLPGAFISLGPDEEMPVVTIARPGPRSLVGAGATVRVSVAANDGLGALRMVTATVSIGLDVLAEHACDVPARNNTWTCDVDFVAPAPAGDGDLIAITATATDIAGNANATTNTFRLAPRPSLTSMTPGIGPASGGTTVEVRGSNFILPTETSDGSALLVDGQALKTEVLDATTLQATTANHDPGPGRVAVSNGGAESGQMIFQFVDTPIVRAITPTHGPVTGGTRVIIVGNNFRGLHTTILFGSVVMKEICVISSGRIEGLTPAGVEPGVVSVRANDKNGGSHALLDAFRYDPVDGEPPPPETPPTCDGPP